MDFDLSAGFFNREEKEASAEMDIFFSKHINYDQHSKFECYVIFIDETLKLNAEVSRLDKYVGGLVSILASNPDIFDGEFGKVKTLSFNIDNTIKHLVLIGVGNVASLEDYKIESLGVIAHNKAFGLKASNVLVNADVGARGDYARNASIIARGFKLASYKFDKYITKSHENKQKPILGVVITLDDYESANKMYRDYDASIVAGVFSARNYMSEPPNVLYPGKYSEMLYDELQQYENVVVEIIDESSARDMGMGAFYGVSRGSSKEGKIVIFSYYNNGDAKPVVFVGKGVTFDTGGISIKPASGMEKMKYDMGGAAAIGGAVLALAARKAKTNVVGIVGLVENMPDGNAQRPGDIVNTLSGQTIEVINTDAEGRLVLADLLWYAQDRFKPALMVDLATLTGAISIALGFTYAGLFSNDDELADQIIKSGKKTNEQCWRMPLHEDYEKLMNSDVADIANLSTSDPGVAGSATAANFLQKFVNKCKWAHIDIAGTAWRNRDPNSISKSPNGFGVKLLNQFIRDFYEQD